MRIRRDSKGFTIIELMIALSILSTILMMSTFIMIQIGKWYSKGVNAANLQNDSRTVISDISGALQFNGGTFRTGSATYAGIGNVYAYCVNNVRYSYVLNRELGDDQGYASSDTHYHTNHVLWRDTMRTAANCNPLNLSVAGSPTDSDSLSPSPDGSELIGNHMRLQDLCIAANSDIYTVTANLGFGDNDLLRNSAVAPTSPCNGGKMTCNGGPGNEYCSASNLSTIVKKRIE